MHIVRSPEIIVFEQAKTSFFSKMGVLFKVKAFEGDF